MVKKIKIRKKLAVSSKYKEFAKEFVKSFDIEKAAEEVGVNVTRVTELLEEKDSKLSQYVYEVIDRQKTSNKYFNSDSLMAGIVQVFLTAESDGNRLRAGQILLGMTGKTDPKENIAQIIDLVSEREARASQGVGNGTTGSTG